MLNPQSAFSDINNEVSKKNDARKEYIDETAYSEQVVDVDVNFSDGTIPVTDELAAVAKVAIQGRINNVKEYTKERIERVNKNMKGYYSDTSVSNDSKSLAEVFIPETFNAVEDWSDDLLLMFANMIDELLLEDVGDTVEQFIAKSLEVTEVDDEKKQGLLRSLARFLFNKENTGETDNYYFRKLDIIKSFLERGLYRSKYKERVEGFLRMGIISGMFVLKDDWGATGEYKLCQATGAKDTGNYNASLKYELEQEDVYLFHPVDSRLLIFPKHGMTWVTEMMPTTFHDLLNMVLDANGKEKKNAKYDLKMLKKLAKHLKDVGASAVKKDDHTLSGQKQDYDDTETSDLWDIDGNITLYESHAIPLVMGKGKNKKVYKCMISSINLSAKEEEPDLLPIGIQKTPYVAGIPYLTTNFIERDGDISGVGLPELVEPLQKMLNNFAGHSVDILNLALWGVMVIDPGVFKDTTKLKEITPRLILQLKNMKGRRVDEVVQWLHPKLDTLSSMGDMFNLFQQELNRTTRKGPTGEKITPNPSATEFETIAIEAEKSVSKVGLRVNNLFSKMLERVYIYNMLNLKSRFKLKSQSYRIKPGNKGKELSSLINSGSESSYVLNDKSIELSPQEIFVDGLNFKLTAADTFNKKAVEKQQAMQITKLLLESGAIKNEDGTQHVMQDETGKDVFISEYKVYKQLLDYFDSEDLFEKVKANETSQQQNGLPPIDQGIPGSSPPTAGPGVPPLAASPQTGDVLQQASTLSQGVNV